MPRIPKQIVKALDETGLPWEVIPKFKHRFIKLNGHIVVALPLVGYKEFRHTRHMQNTIASIKRAARRIKGENNGTLS